MKKAKVNSGIVKAMEKAELNLDDNKIEVEFDDKKDDAVETLEQITDEWFAQRRTMFENTTLASHERNSNCHGFKLFKDTLFKKRRVIDILRLYLPKIMKFLKRKIRKILIRLIEYILKVEKT
jgi:hypothetical protein